MRHEILNPASDRLIQSIVNDGMEKGWLRQTKRLGQPGTEQIWIVPETQQGSDAATSKAFAALSEAADTGGPQLDEQLKYRRTQERSSKELLGKGDNYCPKPIRDLLFQAIEEIVNEGEAGVTVARLTSMARQRAESLQILRLLAVCHRGRSQRPGCLPSAFDGRRNSGPQWS